MGPAGKTSEPEAPTPSGLTVLGEVACRYQAAEVNAEDLPMVAAEALAAGLDTPTLCELAGWPRTADTQDVRDAFEQALSESGIELPDPTLAQRHALRRLAAGLVDGDIAPADLATNDRGETEAGTAEERAFARLIPQCSCCPDHASERERRTWAAELRIAADALLAAVPIGPGC